MMQITSKFNMDLCRQETVQRIWVMQADTNTRLVEVMLCKNGVAWSIPEGVSAALGYRKPDGTAGLYDKLPDGTDALTIEGNMVSVVLVPQMLTVPGLVRAVITLNDADMHQLSTFPFEIVVKGNPTAGNIVSENYCYYTNLDAISKALGDISRLKVGENLVSAVNELADMNGVDFEGIQKIVEQWLENHSMDSSSVRYVPQKLTEEQKIQARENIGAASIAGVYELLETIAVTENVQSIYREYPEGLKALVVKFMIPGITAYSYIRVRTNHKNTTDYLDTVFTLSVSDSIRGFRAEIYPSFGFYKQDGYMPYNQYNNVNNALAGSNASTILIEEKNYIHGITITALTVDAIAEGTEIMVYGVRANE